jgi:D-alanyl-D-alanine endopeptidase (penicillin-binding protein 7)
MIDALLGNLIALSLPQPHRAQANISSLPVAADVRPAVVLGPRKKRPESLGVKTAAPSVFVADVRSGAVLFAKDPHRVMPIASITKLVTAMVFLDQNLDMNKTVTFLPGDFDGESRGVFKPGDEITNEDLLRSLLIGSVNASANVMARTTLGMEKFVEAMNIKMKQLGLKTPSFVEPSGIDPENKASAADVAAILSIASGYPDIRRVTGQGDIDVSLKNAKNSIHIPATNLLLKTYLNKDPYKIVAAKTGSLPEAGYCMAQLTKNAQGNEIVAVELGNDNHFSRYQDIKAMTAWAFETYQWEK